MRRLSPRVNGIFVPKEIFTFRPATEADVGSMWEIDQLCFEPDIAYPLDVFYYHLLINRDHAYVAEKGGKIIGFFITHK